MSEMIESLPVYAKPPYLIAGSNFDVLNPTCGVKIVQGTKEKKASEDYEELAGQQSKATYLTKQGQFQSDKINLKEKDNIIAIAIPSEGFQQRHRGDKYSKSLANTPVTERSEY